jgi:hypothetical protein
MRENSQPDNQQQPCLRGSVMPKKMGVDTAHHGFVHLEKRGGWRQIRHLIELFLRGCERAKLRRAALTGKQLFLRWENFPSIQPVTWLKAAGR